jgi:hypothetical protein
VKISGGKRLQSAVLRNGKTWRRFSLLTKNFRQRATAEMRRFPNGVRAARKILGETLL